MAGKLLTSLIESSGFFFFNCDSTMEVQRDRRASLVVTIGDRFIKNKIKKLRKQCVEEEIEEEWINRIKRIK
jgi:hypothetical protein